MHYKFRNKIRVRKATCIVVPRGSLRDRQTKFQEAKVGKIALAMVFFSESFRSEFEKELVSPTKDLRQSTYMHLTER